MKKLILIILAIFAPALCFSQEQEPVIVKDKNGIIQSVEFPDSIEISKIPSSADDFFRYFLKTSPNDEFKNVPHKEKREGFINEHFDQYYRGIKVDNAGYNFHYKNGRMFYAHGHYVKIIDLNIHPSITPEKARDCFADFCGIPLDSIADFISELIIKEIPYKGNNEVLLPMLAYRIRLCANHKNNTNIGYVDAHTGEVLLTEPVFIDFSATGTFATRYSGTRQGITQYYQGYYHLADSTRGAIIHTWNLNGNASIDYREELSDNDNNWTAAEHSANENDMGLDIHWAIQQIYDRLNNVHQINSFDDGGFPIDAYIHWFYQDNACWDPDINALFFGDGNTAHRPLASVDVVSHEFGHGITDFQIGWSNTGNPGAFNEGLSDIWGVILESRIRPNSVWRIGEQIEINYSCGRNIQYTNDPTAEYQIANTYGGATYNNATFPYINYIRGGVFSHWFYLLVNGGSGTNEIGNYYTVYGVGMDLAENLIVEAVFNNFLDNTTTWAEIRTGMINAAIALCSGSGSLLQRQVDNAWYAVGVGGIPSQVLLIGPTLVCSSGSAFAIYNHPDGSTIQWSCGPYLTRVSSQGSNPCTFSSTGSGSSWIRAKIFTCCGDTITIQHNVWSGVPQVQITGSSSGCFGSEYTFYANYPQYSNPTSFEWSLSPEYWCNTIYGYDWWANAHFDCPYEELYQVRCTPQNACGVGNMANTYIYIYDCGYGYSLSPNPASTEVTVTVTRTDNINIAVNDIFNVSIYDGYGVKYFQGKCSGDRFTIPVYNLKNGKYIVRIDNGKNVVNKQLVIMH